jgi:hypothetical protein
MSLVVIIERRVGVKVFREGLRAVFVFHEGLRSVSMVHDGPRPIVHDILPAADSRPGKARPVTYKRRQQDPDNACEHQDDTHGVQIEVAYVSALHGEREDRPEDYEGNTGCDGHDASPFRGWIVSLGMS